MASPRVNPAIRTATMQASITPMTCQQAVAAAQSLGLPQLMPVVLVTANRSPLAGQLLKAGGEQWERDLAGSVLEGVWSRDGPEASEGCLTFTGHVVSAMQLGVPDDGLQLGLPDDGLQLGLPDDVYSWESRLEAAAPLLACPTQQARLPATAAGSAAASASGAGSVCGTNLHDNAPEPVPLHHGAHDVFPAGDGTEAMDDFAACVFMGLLSHDQAEGD